MYLLIFEFLGTNEVLVILVVALILLGPRKLPQMSRKLGKSLGEFRKASEEFKHTWEREVDLETTVQDIQPQQSMLPSTNSIPDDTIDRNTVAGTISQTVSENEPNLDSLPAPTVTPIDPSILKKEPVPVSNEPTATTPTRKRDWL